MNTEEAFVDEMNYDRSDEVVKKRSNSLTGDHDISTEISKKLKFEPPLYMQRYDHVCNLLNKFKCKTYLDIGCAECKLIRFIKNSNHDLNLIVGLDIDQQLLDNSKEKFTRILFDFVQPRKQPLDLYLISGDSTNMDSYFVNQMKRENSGLDFVSLVEVIEHMQPSLLEKLNYNVFGRLKPKYVYITTPNREFNVIFDELERDQMCIDERGDCITKKSEFRHWDHKFEWTRHEFETWCRIEILQKYSSYQLCGNFSGIGSPPSGYEHVGFCTQTALFVYVDDENYMSHGQNLNLFDRYLVERKRLSVKNRLSFESRQKHFLYFMNEYFPDDGSYKLVLDISYPFECYDFENDSDLNQALLGEINYLIMFLIRPGYKGSSKYSDMSTFTDPSFVRIQEEKIANDVDPNDESVFLVEIDKLLDFNSIKKFKLERERLINILKGEYKFTRSTQYIIYTLQEDNKNMIESDNESSESVIINSDHNKSNEPNDDWDETESDREGQQTPISNQEDLAREFFSEPEWTSETIPPINSETDSSINTSNDVNSFEEEYWDAHLVTPIVYQPKPKPSPQDQFADFDADTDPSSQVEINYAQMMNECKKSNDFHGYNYYANKQREMTVRLRSISRKKYRELEKVVIVENFQFSDE